jgi:xanthine/uracil/vitamin C permease (AzgA family)
MKQLGGIMLDKYFNYKKHKTNFQTEVMLAQQRF